MANRDPRTDPQRGDWTVTRKTSEPELEKDWFWLVLERRGDDVVYLDDKGRPNTTDLFSWRQGSAGDEVLHVAE
jgi:hypothetical protein